MLKKTLTSDRNIIIVANCNVEDKIGNFRDVEKIKIK